MNSHAKSQPHFALTSEHLPLKTRFALLRAVGAAHGDALQQGQCVAAALAAPPCGSCVQAEHPHADCLLDMLFLGFCTQGGTGLIIEENRKVWGLEWIPTSQRSCSVLQAVKGGRV